ncbi:MAG: hypothetical protein U0229_07215 [Anaeromyxobacter sp.]
MMTIYVGLSDDLRRRKAEHGNPPDWKPYGPFLNEDAARAWEKLALAQPGTKGGPGGAGWRFGYSFTLTPTTEPRSPGSASDALVRALMDRRR